MKKILLILFGLFILLVLGVVGYLGYLGFVPGVSKIFGSDTPRDLGINYSDTDLANFLSKTKFEVETSTSESPSESLSFSEPKEITTTLTDNEASASLNNVAWKYMPVENIQVKFNSDGSVEVSGKIIMDKVQKALQTFGYEFTQEQINTAVKSLDIIPVDPVFYAKATPQAVNNEVTINVTNVEIGRLKINPDKYNLDEVSTEFRETVFSKITGFNAEKVTFENGKMSFIGTTPTAAQVLK